MLAAPGPQVARQQEVRAQTTVSRVEHAREGMPWYKRRLRKSNNWPKFGYHVNSRSCEFLRAIFQHSQPGTTSALLSEALIGNAELLEVAGSWTWTELAEHRLVRASIHHCVECGVPSLVFALSIQATHAACEEHRAAQPPGAVCSV